jgi:hypothetical protein
MWRRNMMNGKGIYIRADGSVTRGEWKEGVQIQ